MKQTTWSVNDPASTAKIVLTGTVKVKFTWVDGAGNPAPNPPSQVYVHERSVASYSTSVPTNLVTISNDNADNGFQSPCVKSGNPANAGTSLSHKDELKDSSSGTVEVTVTQTANVTVTKRSGTATSGYGTLGVSHEFSAFILTHAHPVKMRRDPYWPDVSIIQSANKLRFDYIWDSTGGAKMPDAGSLPDLSQCRVYEYVTWSGSGHIDSSTDPLSYGYPLAQYFYFDSPPYAPGSIANPTVNPGESTYNGSAGAASDTFGAPIPMGGNYFDADAVGIQDYRFHCGQCMASGEYEKLLGPFTINFTVLSLNNHWLFVVSRDGVSTHATLN